jgi:hypothetical protein
VPSMFRPDPSVLVRADAIRANRRLVARLEQRDTNIATDLGWITTQVTELALLGGNADTSEVTWFGLLNLDPAVLIAKAGHSLDQRVTVEEWEGIEADPEPFAAAGPLTTEWRLVYADHLAL